MTEKFDELVDAIVQFDAAGQGSKATSIRLPDALHRAVIIATDLGMDASFTAAVSEGLAQRVRAFVRREALARHLARFPHDRPSLGAVAHRRVRGSDHPAARHPDLVDDVAGWVERRVPGWAVSGSVDETVDRVLDHVELLVARVGAGPEATN